LTTVAAGGRPTEGNPVLKHAITRRPGKDLADGLTTAALGAPDFDLACRQFEAYCEALAACGLTVSVLEALAGYPDAHFVEDTAVVTPAVGVIARPGADSRLGEESSIAAVLADFRPLARIEDPGTLDGGDVLVIGTHYLIGISDRTNDDGARQLGMVLESHGCTWETVPVGAGLHLKSSVNHVGDETLLVEPAFADHPALIRYRRIEVPASEAYAANTLLVNDRLIMPAGYAATRAMLEPLGREIIEIDAGEFRKMDGGLTCLSLRF
jgi:dimethylargininase